MLISLLCLLVSFSHAIIVNDYDMSWVNKEAPLGKEMRLPWVGKSQSIQPLSSRPCPGLELVYETLIEKTWDTDIYLPLLAKEISFGKQVSIVLNDACFSDHHPITASDVLYSFSYFKSLPLDHQLHHFLQQVKLRIVDDKHLILETKLPPKDVESLLSLIPIIPTNHDPSLSMKGSGPYLLKKQTSQDIHYQRNPDYWGWHLPLKQGRYNFQSILYKIYPSHIAAAFAFQKDQVDFYLEHSASHWQHVKSDERSQYMALAHPSQLYLQVLRFNPKPPIHDQTMRSLLNVIDSGFINHWFYQDQYLATPLDPDYQKHHREKLLQAASFLDQSGWVMQSDGYRYKNQEKLSLTLITPPSSFSPLLTLLQKDYRKLGIHLEIKKLSKSSYHDLKKKGQYHLMIESILVDKKQKVSFDLLKTDSPKANLLYKAYQKSSPPLSYPLFKTMLNTLEKEDLLIPLWGIDCFRIGYKTGFHFVQDEKPYIDLYAFWYE